MIVVVDGRTCTCCKRLLSPDNYRKKRNGEYNKQCSECLDLARCEHEKQKNKCKLCLGSGICIHKRIQSSCKECKGGSVCIHNKIRSRR